MLRLSQYINANSPQIERVRDRAPKLTCMPRWYGVSSAATSVLRENSDPQGKIICCEPTLACMSMSEMRRPSRIMRSGITENHFLVC